MRRLLFLAGLAAFVVPPMAAAYTKRQHPSVGDESSDDLDLVTIFEGRELHSVARSFRGGKVLCWYGGGLLDLTGATLDPGGARLDVRCFFGGMEIRVPLDWHVELRGTSFFGGAGDSRPTAGAASMDGPTLVIESTNAFGGFGITGPRSADAPEPTTVG